MAGASSSAAWRLRTCRRKTQARHTRNAKAPICGKTRHESGSARLFWLFNVYATRVNLSVAVLQMKPQFGWSSLQQGIILSSFFIGYICFAPKLQGGWLETRFGGKWSLVAVSCAQLCSLLRHLGSLLITRSSSLFASWKVLAKV